MPPKRKKKMLVIKDEPKIPVGYVRGDDGKLRKKNFLKDVKPLQNISAHASALSASAQNSTSRMEFPDDISSLITQFAKPIKDRGLIKTNPSKWTKLDKAKFIDYLQSEYDFAYAPTDEDGPRFDMESEYYDENMEAYYDIHNEHMIESLLSDRAGRGGGGSTGKLDGKTYRELGNILGDLIKDVIYFNEYSGKPFDDQLRARFERDEDNKGMEVIKKNILREMVSAIDTYIPFNSGPQFPSVSKKMLTLKIKNQAYFDKIKKEFVVEDEGSLLDKLAEHINEQLLAEHNDQLYELEQEDRDNIENKLNNFIDIFIKRLVNDMLKESVPVDEMLRSVYWLYDGSEIMDYEGGETNYSKTMDVYSNFGHNEY